MGIAHDADALGTLDSDPVSQNQQCSASDGVTGLGLGVLMLVTGYILPGSTADGTPVGPGVAACPAWMPFGTALNVDGFGSVVCHDRYADGQGDLIDVWVPTLAEAYAVTGYRMITSDAASAP